MQPTLKLSIAITCLASLQFPAYATQTAPTQAAATAVSGGKCASGKCGTEKMYSKADIAHDPNGVLVRARDGKCGLAGQGYNVTVSEQTKLADGVCGQ